MDYIDMPASDAVKIIENLKSNNIIVSIIDFDRIKCTTVKTDKSEAIELINGAAHINFNDDEYVRNFDLSFEGDNKLVKLLVGN